MKISANLKSPSPSFPFESKFTKVRGFNIHYVEQGHGEPILFLHGNPTSSYLWRNVIPAVANGSGRRAIAVDLLGFGKSEKPDDIEYSLKLHAEIVAGVIQNLRLKNLILVADDWGGPLATYYAVHHATNVQGLALMETFLWPMNWKQDFAPEFRAPFKMMRSPLGFFFVQVFNIMTKKLIPQHCPISKESLDHYIKTFPTVKSRRAMAAFPKLLPVEGKPKESYDFFMEIQQGFSELQFPVVWIKAQPGVVPSDDYPSTLKRLEDLKARLPHLEIKEFGPGHHFLAEENPERLSRILVQWLREQGFARQAFQASR
jgi:haloalkane dehalogenase